LLTLTSLLFAFQTFIPAIEEALQSACKFDDDCPARLAEAIRYALLAPGKRLRPALVLMAARACGSESDIAVAVEMIHAYSLIHDDLPAMDDDDLRRGRPTVHIQFGESTAILAGDALQAEAFGHLCTHIADHELARKAVAILAKASGAGGLVGGQADDLDAESLPELSPNSARTIGNHAGADAHDSGSPKTIPGFLKTNPGFSKTTPSRSIDFLEFIHRRKTGALFSASINLGSLLGGGTELARHDLALFAKDLGLAFQVVDDLLDATAADETLGKRSGKDLDRGKLTYVGLMGVDGARAKSQQLISEAKRHLNRFGADADPLRELADYVQERSH
jgi:geranylgeranyl diphosphate synthase, type II